MRAIRLTAPCAIEGLTVSEVPIPSPRPGWARVRVRAFGVNESEVTSRQGGSSPDFSFPRVLGIEGVGEVDAVAPGSSLEVGQQVATMMGGMGRAFDGSYAEYVLVPEDQLIPFTSDLPWEVLGALPEMTQTAYGSLTSGMGLQPGQTVLVRGGTSTVGLMAIGLAHLMGATVLATSRRAERADLLRQQGADHVVLDDGHVADAVHGIVPDGADAALELVGLTALPDTLRAVRPGGTVCFTGALAGGWVGEPFNPFALIPSTVRLTVYAGEARDLPPAALARFLDHVAAGRLRVPLAGVYHGLDEVGQAHAATEAGQAPGKNVVVL